MRIRNSSQEKNKLNLAIATLLVIFGILAAQTDHRVIIDQTLVSTATITDPDLIEFFINSYLIPEENVSKLQFIDATGNGFGEEDLIKCFPSGKTYYLFPSDEAQAVMDQWEFTSNFQSVTQNKPPDVFEVLTTDKAQNWILAALLRGLNQHYHDLPMKIYFERDSSTITFEMWGYNPDALQWVQPPPPVVYPDTVYDLVHLFRSDTLYIADTTYYDQFYIFHSVSDTFFISEKDRKALEAPLNPDILPGLVEPPKRKNRKSSQ